MTPKETEEIYKNACRSKRVVPQIEEGRMWHKALSMCDVRDVRSALDAWWASTEKNDRGELKSKWLPAPGELKPLIDEAARRRMNAAAQPTELVRWQCPDCHVTMSGLIATNDYRTRTCRRCGAQVNEIYRGAAA
jgi:hypothetical protein